MKDRLKDLVQLVTSISGMIITITLMIAVGLCVVFLAVSPIFKYWTQADSTLPSITTNQHTIMLDKNGNQFAEVWSEDRKIVPSLNDVSPIMRESIVSAEDKGFYSHGAIDAPATIRSFITGSGGGSGITQQLIKNLLFYDSTATAKEKKSATATTISRKIRELKLAMNYERNHSKDDILLNYLNTIAIGSPNVYGIETASEVIFNKNAKDLTLSEAAALAGSVNNTSEYNLKQMDDSTVAARVKERQTYVLDRLLANGKISRKDHDKAVKDPIATHVQSWSGSCGSSKYPFYCQLVINYLLDDTMLGSTANDRARTVSAGGFEIKTSLDPTMLEQLNAQLKTDWGVTNPKVQSTAVVQPGTGYILAIGSNRDWGSNTAAGQTEVVIPSASTQTGSTYKMMTLSAALNAGWTEDQLNAISSQCPWNKPGFDVPLGGILNSTSCALQGGHLTYRQATAYSANTWFVELESRIGVNAVKNFSKSVGLSAPDSIGPRSVSYTLGVSDNSVINMAAAYATFAAEGVYCPATPITSMSRIDGNAIQAPDDWNPNTNGCRSVMSPHSASVVLKALDANINGTDIPGRFGQMGVVPGHFTVGKSGTTDNYANQVWAQIVGQYVVYSNAYDPRGNFKYPMDYYVWRGYSRGPYAEAALQSTRDFISTNLSGSANASLDLGSTDTKWKKVGNVNKNMVIVPDLTGMSPSSALSSLRSLGLEGEILKRSELSDGSIDGGTLWSSHVIVKQSVSPGTRLVVGSDKIIELTLSKTTQNGHHN
jgi:membrane peptidoglycan carboxypeptidase